MNNAALCSLTLVELASLIRRKQVSPVEVTRACIERSEQLQPTLNAYITPTYEHALREAHAAEDRLMRGEVAPLLGVPLAHKDVFNTAGVRTTGGSKILGKNVPTKDATVIRRLRDSGAISLGKLNMHEFAFGATNANPHYGATRNPHDTARITGGSSGGSAAAVASGCVFGSLGSDTGGSIRQPASLCGIVGMQPTLGRVSRHGVLRLSWSFDTVGPMTRRVADAALMLRVIAGHDANDEASSSRDVPDYTAALTGDVRGVRVGVAEAFLTAADVEVAEGVRAAVEELEGAGAIIARIELPLCDEARAAHRTIVFAEAAAYHARWLRDRPDDYGEDVRQRLRVGALIPAADYVNAHRVRRGVIAAWREAWRGFDIVVLPTTGIAATRLGEMTIDVRGQRRDVFSPYLLGTWPFNLLGLPAISVPCGYTQSGLPFGLQLVGRPLGDALVLRVAHAYEQLTRWGERRVPL